VDGVDVAKLEESGFDVILHKLCSHIALEKLDEEKGRELRLLEGKGGGF
jgi:hypothetical protein